MNYSKRNIRRKQKILRADSTQMYSKFKFWFFRLGITTVIGSLVVGTCAITGFLAGIIDNAPIIDETQIEPATYASTIYDNQGQETYQLVGSNANRIAVSLDEIPEDLQNAFIAIEDERFYSHKGIDPKGILRAASSTLSSGSLGQGASTITQQLIKNVVFSGGNEQSSAAKIQRKIQEQYLALQLEQKVSKKDILKNYLNTINLGQNTLGVQAAALRYFDKDVSKLTLSECAVIAGITKNPSSLNPISYPENNSKRRISVLDHMLSLKMITEKEYKDALEDDVYKRIQKVNAKKTKTSNLVTSYFTDAVIDQVLDDLQMKLGYTEEQAINLLYRGGIKIYTTQDKKMQKICDSVISNKSYYPFSTQYSLEYRLSILDSDGKTHNYDELTMEKYFKQSYPYFDLIFSDKKSAKEATNKYNKALPKQTGGTLAGEVVSITLQPQISFVLMEPSTGEVKAIVGGRGEKTASRTLNRATGSTRQPGSTFKVLSAFLPALDACGMSLASVYDDSTYYYPGTEKQVKNWYTDGYLGLTTIRDAIKKSMNIVTIKTMEQVTPELSLSYLKELGFTTLVDNSKQSPNDLNLSTALGGLTYGVTNYEATAAYSAIANGGVYKEPILYTKIVDHSGNVLLENNSDSKCVMKESTAFLLTDAMKDVVTSGTGTLTKFTTSSMPVAGKTGTTSDNVDAWFIGYTPYYCAGIWTGYDDNTSLSSTTYHKVIWRTIMEQIHSDLQVKDFSKPESIVSAKICTKSGKLAKPGVCENAQGGSTVRTEYFAGSAPTEYCNTHICVNLCEASGQVANSGCPSDQVYSKIMLKKEETGTTQDSPYVISKEQLHTLCSQHKGDGSYEPPAELEETTVPEEPSSTDIASTIMPTEKPETVSNKTTKQPKHSPEASLKTKAPVAKETASPGKKSSKTEATQKATSKPTAKVTTKPTTKPTAKTATKPTAKTATKPTTKPTAKATTKPTAKVTKAPVSPDHSVG